jgi:hypothetical protein
MYPVYRLAVRSIKCFGAGYDVIVGRTPFDDNRITPYFEILKDEKVYFIAIKPTRK